MWVSNSVNDGLKIFYIKWVGSGEPRFYPAHGDSDESYDTIDGHFVRCDKWIYKSENYGEKTQMWLTLEDQGIIYQIRASMTWLTRSIVNSLCSRTEIWYIKIKLKGWKTEKDGKTYNDNKAFINDDKNELLRWKYGWDTLSPLIETETTREGTKRYFDKVDDLLFWDVALVKPIEHEDKKFWEDKVDSVKKDLTPDSKKEKAKEALQGNIWPISTDQKWQIEKLVKILQRDNMDLGEYLKKKWLNMFTHMLNSAEAYKVIEDLVSMIMWSQVRLTLDGEDQKYVEDIWSKPQDTNIPTDAIASVERKLDQVAKNDDGLDDLPF